jgi:alkanesulfonate monooxygenase SsuD/methylene tetrahydromethanopterin reductase-like flavin-dependent oxidoreductase (luciferase family)
VSRLEESVILLKRLLTEEHVDHTGEHYTVRGAQILPRPLQRPHPPLMIGGGRPRVLRLAARQADIVTSLRSERERSAHASTRSPRRRSPSV